MEFKTEFEKQLPITKEEKVKPIEIIGGIIFVILLFVFFYLAFYVASASASTYTDDFDGYATGTLSGQGSWTTYDSVAPLTVVNTTASSSPNSIQLQVGIQDGIGIDFATSTYVEANFDMIGNKHIYIYWQNDNGLQTSWGGDISQMTTSTWKHVKATKVISYASSTEYYEIFVDDVSVASTSDSIHEDVYRFCFYGPMGGEANTYIDNFSFYTGVNCVDFGNYVDCKDADCEWNFDEDYCISYDNLPDCDTLTTSYDCQDGAYRPIPYVQTNRCQWTWSNASSTYICLSIEEEFACGEDDHIENCTTKEDCEAVPDRDGNWFAYWQCDEWWDQIPFVDHDSCYCLWLTTHMQDVIYSTSTPPATTTEGVQTILNELTQDLGFDPVNWIREKVILLNPLKYAPLIFFAIKRTPITTAITNAIIPNAIPM